MDVEHWQRECDNLEVMQNGFGRWLWEVGNVRNELVRIESGWSSFVEREVKCVGDWLLRIVYEESLVSDIGRVCLMEVGYKYRWWARGNHVCDKFGLWELMNLLWLKNINKEGIAMLGMKCVEEDFGGENPGGWQETVEKWFWHK